MHYKWRVTFLFFVFIFVKHFFSISAMETCQHHVKYPTLLAYAAIVGLYLGIEISAFRKVKPLATALIWLCSVATVFSIPSLLVVLSLILHEGGEYCYDFFWLDFCLSIMVNLTIVGLVFMVFLKVFTFLRNQKRQFKVSNSLKQCLKTSKNLDSHSLQLLICNFESFSKVSWTPSYFAYLADGYKFENLSDHQIERDCCRRYRPKPTEECPICLESLENSNYISHPTCGHVYHESCLASWLIPGLSKSGSKTAGRVNRFGCPMCRNNTMIEFFIDSKLRAFQMAEEALRSQPNKKSSELLHQLAIEKIASLQLIGKIRELEKKRPE